MYWCFFTGLCEQLPPAVPGDLLPQNVQMYPRGLASINLWERVGLYGQ